MELKPNERLIAEEDICQEAIDELTPIKEQMSEIEVEGRRLAAEIDERRTQMDVIKSKAKYLSKLKWSIFDRYHPKTNQANFTPGPNMNARRSYDWEAKKLNLVEYPLEREEGGLSDILMGILGEALGDRPNKPKSKDPEPTPAAAAETTVP